MEPTTRRPVGPIHNHCVGCAGCRSVARPSGNVWDQRLGTQSCGAFRRHRNSTGTHPRSVVGRDPRPGILSALLGARAVACLGRYVRRLEGLAPRANSTGAVGGLPARRLVTFQRLRKEVSTGHVQRLPVARGPRTVSHYHVRLPPDRFPADGYGFGTSRHTRSSTEHPGPDSAGLGRRRQTITDERRIPASRCDTRSKTRSHLRGWARQQSRSTRPVQCRSTRLLLAYSDQMIRSKLIVQFP